jgi:nucleotide-binding universal stress UspA family protein
MKSEATPMTPRIDLILVGIDGSEEARQALEWSIVIARRCDAELLVVHAAGLLTHLDEGHITPTQSHLSELRQRFEHEWCSSLAESGVSHRLVLLEGPPVLALLEAAHSEGADLIVVGRRGVGKGPGLLFGSTSHQLAESSHKPVLIVPSAVSS